MKQNISKRREPPRKNNKFYFIANRVFNALQQLILKNSLVLIGLHFLSSNFYSEGSLRDNITKYL